MSLFVIAIVIAISTYVTPATPTTRTKHNKSLETDW